MKMDKIVLKSVVSTLCAMAILCGVAFGLAVWLYPSTMMRISYAVGNDVGAMKYAYRAYEATDELYYVAFATEVAIGMDEPEDVEYYAEKFVAESEKFDAYCAEIDRKNGYEKGRYKRYVCGRLVVAKYELGEVEEAKAYAFSTLGGGFAENNAVVALLFAARQKSDAVMVKRIVDELKTLTVTGEKDVAYLTSLLAAFDKLN